MLKRLKVLMFLVLMQCMWTSLSNAQGVYDASVSVENQSLVARDAAVAQAAAQVLRNVSGNKHITENSTIQKSLMHASEWVESYRYTHATSSAHNGRPFVFHVSFSQKKVDAAIKNLVSDRLGPKISTAVAKKPTLLFLVVNSTAGKKYLLSETNSNLAKEIKGLAQKNHLKVLLPLLDLEEQTMVDVETILQVIRSGKIEGDAASDLRKMMQRYAPETVVFGVLASNNEKPWKSQWFVINHAANITQHEERWGYVAASMRGHLNFFVQSLRNVEQQSLISKGDGHRDLMAPDTVGVHVSGIKDGATYNEIFSYLKNIEGMLWVKPAMMTMDNAVFNVRWNEEITQLQSILRQDKVLREVNAMNIPKGVQDSGSGSEPAKGLSARAQEFPLKGNGSSAKHAEPLVLFYYVES